MFRNITIRNFKSLAHVSVELGPFTVLVGRNGAGKSSFLQAIDLASWAVRYDSLSNALSEHGIDFTDLVSLRSKRQEIQFTATFDWPKHPKQETRSLNYRVIFVKRRAAYVENEFFGQTWTANRKIEEIPPLISREDELLGTRRSHSLLRPVYQGTKGRSSYPELYYIAEHFAHYVHYEIWGPEMLRRPSFSTSLSDASNGSTPLLDAKGRGLPLLLRSIRSRSPRDWKALLAQLRQSYPQIADIRFRRGLEKGEVGLEFSEESSRNGKGTYRSSQVSDGVLRLLALLALRYAPVPLKVIGYEEPENGLHPSALDDCMRHLKAIASRGTQVIVTTHSPYLLNHLLEDQDEPKVELRLVWRREDGTTRIAEPDPEKIARAKRHGFGLGELWGMLLDERELAKRDQR